MTTYSPTEVAHFTVDATSTPIDWSPGRVNDWSANVQVYGTFGGGTVTLEASLDGTNYSAIDGGAFTAAGVKILKLKPCKLRATLSGSTSPGIYVKIT